MRIVCDVQAVCAAVRTLSLASMCHAHFSRRSEGFRLPDAAAADARPGVCGAGWTLRVWTKEQVHTDPSNEIRIPVHPVPLLL